MNTHIGKVMVIEPRAAQILFLHIEPQRARQVEVSAGTCAHADSVAGVRGDTGLVEDDVDEWHKK
ncbi:hypothetical protein GCM10009621_01090 [Corynebacterium felinum]